MKVFRCGDVVPGCSAAFEDHSEDRVVAAVGEHARRDHGVEVDDVLSAEIRSRVRDS